MQLHPADIPNLNHFELAEHIRLAKVNPGLYVGLEDPLMKELEVRSPTQNFRCMKCGHGKCQVDQIRTPRTFLSSFFNVQSAKYAAVVCSRCAFTEFYQGQVSAGEQAADFVFGS